MMKHGYTAVALAVLALAGAAVFWPDDENPAAKEETAAVRAAAASPDSGKTPTTRENRRPPADPARLEEAAADIHDAVLTYDPAGVAVIRPFLLDPDPAVRREARDGMVQLGEADAVPWLRDAASKLEDPAEIAALREAADLLALPAWSDSEEAREAVEEIRRNR
jgi:hypothetical protein